MDDRDNRTERIAREEEKHQSDRQNLLGEESLKRRRRKAGSSSHATTSSNKTASEAASIQQSLNRTNALLQNELQRVSHVASAIDSDGKVLQETMEEQQTMNVSGAKKALTSLQRAQQQEERYLIASIVFFWAVVVYIFWCRVILHLPLIDTLVLSTKGLFSGSGQDY